MSFTHALATNRYGEADIIVSTNLANGTHSTLTSAMAAAVSGQTIFLRDSVTENVTVTPGVNIAAWAAGTLNTPTITGTLTMTGAGTSTISGIRLQTNSAALISVTGSANSVMHLYNCYLNMTNNSGITFSTSGTGAQVHLLNSRGDLGTTGIALFVHTSGGNLSIVNTIINNSGLSSTANTCSSGSVTLLDGAFLPNPLTFSGTGRISAKFSEIDSSATNSTSLTTASGTNNVLEYVRLSSGSATPLSVGGTLTVNGLILHHTNATAVTGAGTLVYSSIFQSSTVGTISANTNTGKSIDTGSISFNQEANALSSYVLGSWTPTITGSTSNPTPTYTVQVGRYVKIGQLVWVTCTVNVSALTGGTGRIEVSGLPFTSQNTANQFPIFSGIFVTTTISRLILEMVPNSNIAGFFFIAEGGSTAVALPQTTTTQITFAGCYQSAT